MQDFTIIATFMFFLLAHKLTSTHSPSYAAHLVTQASASIVLFIPVLPALLVQDSACIFFSLSLVMANFGAAFSQRFVLLPESFVQKGIMKAFLLLNMSI